jgi:hypothetical protein
MSTNTTETPKMAGRTRGQWQAVHDALRYLEATADSHSMYGLAPVNYAMRDLSEELQMRAEQAMACVCRARPRRKGRSHLRTLRLLTT